MLTFLLFPVEIAIKIDRLVGKELNTDDIEKEAGPVLLQKLHIDVEKRKKRKQIDECECSR